MRYVASDECKVKGPGRALLWVIAYHADRDTGECWVGQRRLARESGFARSTVQRALDELFGDGVLEPVEDHRGPLPERYMIAPGLVEGESFGTNVVEHSATASKVVEGEAIVGEVIHNPGASGLAPGPQAGSGNFLLDRSGSASGPTAGSLSWLVDRSGEASGLLPSPLSSENASQGFKQGFELQGENHVLGDASSAADAAGVAEAREPPASVLAELERRGLRLKPRPAPKPEQQPRSREEQLAYLERIAAEDEAKAKNGQEGKEQPA
jgi:Helix-turn-helix domain